MGNLLSRRGRRRPIGVRGTFDPTRMAARKDIRLRLSLYAFDTHVVFGICPTTFPPVIHTCTLVISSRFTDMHDVAQNENQETI